MAKYTATIDVPRDLKVGNVDEFMEHLRELAAAEFVWQDGQSFPEAIEITIEEDDLWDVYLTARQVEENVAGYLDVQIKIPKPELKGEK